MKTTKHLSALRSVKERRKGAMQQENTLTPRFSAPLTSNLFTT